ncbi:MAG TPA: ATP-binding protein [Mariprofundaceae bacterium]|nr:ATP-binding protein [Mariprofundaceae bacterium]
MRLFWKLLLTLLVALLLTAVVSNWLGQQWSLQNQSIETRLDALEQQGELAMSLYQNDDPGTYRRWLRQGMRKNHSIGFLLDEHGKHVLQRPLPPEFESLATEVMRSGKSIRMVQPTHISVALPVHAENRTMYWLASSRLPAALIRQNRLTQLGIQLAFALGMLFLVSALLARMLTHPMAHLSRAARIFGEGGLTTRPDPALTNRRDEIGDLARNFTTMADHLESLVNSHKQLLRDVSHELRSPLARLGVALEIARSKMDNGGADTLPEELDRIQMEADRLNALIGEVLSLARFDQAAVEMKHETIDLNALLEHLVSDLSFEASADGKHVVLNQQPPARLSGDAIWMRRALENIARNAIRYTDKQGPVEINQGIRNEKITITIRDHGPGVPESGLNRLFDPFYRVSDARERQSGGYGLGLAIARQVVRAHGGAIHAANHAEGGLEITIALPAG